MRFQCSLPGIGNAHAHCGGPRSSAAAAAAAAYSSAAAAAAACYHAVIMTAATAHHHAATMKVGCWWRDKEGHGWEVQRADATVW